MVGPVITESGWVRIQFVNDAFSRDCNGIGTHNHSVRKATFKEHLEENTLFDLENTFLFNKTQLNFFEVLLKSFGIYVGNVFVCS